MACTSEPVRLQFPILSLNQGLRQRCLAPDGRPPDTFYRDVHEGGLPDYAFVEPRLFLNNNDEHPPGTVAAGRVATAFSWWR